MARSRTLPARRSQNFPARMDSVRRFAPKPAARPKIPSASTAPRAGTKALRKPWAMARCIVRILMGPRGTAAAKPTQAATRKRLLSDRKWGRKSWPDMAPVHTRAGTEFHENYAALGKKRVPKAVGGSFLNYPFVPYFAEQVMEDM